VVHIRGTTSKACWVCARACSGVMLNSRHSGMVDRVRPSSTRPPLRWSSVAARSAIRIGWLNGPGASTAECPNRIRVVCCAIAASSNSGAEDRLNSPAPWCSTCHQHPYPNSSANFACAMACWNRRCSWPCGHGRGFWISLNKSIFTRNTLRRTGSHRRCSLPEKIHLLRVGRVCEVPYSLSASASSAVLSKSARGPVQEGRAP